MANEAYGIAGRQANIEMKLAELFMTSLYSEKIAKEIFVHDPPLITMAAIQARATEIAIVACHVHGRVDGVDLWLQQDMSPPWR